MERNLLHIIQGQLLRFTGRYKFLTYNDVDLLVESLAEKIYSSGYVPDAIVGISSGGEYPAILISQDFQTSLALMDVNHYGIKFNGCEIEELVGLYRLAKLLGHSPRVTVEHDIREEEVAGKRVLLVDDDSYSGLTLEVALQSVKEKRPREIRTAVLQTYTGNPLVDFAGRQMDRKQLYGRREIYPWSLLSSHYSNDHKKTEPIHSFTS